jgi:hypothetical protein
MDLPEKLTCYCWQWCCMHTQGWGLEILAYLRLKSPRPRLDQPNSVFNVNLLLVIPNSEAFARIGRQYVPELELLHSTNKFCFPSWNKTTERKRKLHVLSAVFLFTKWIKPSCQTTSREAWMSQWVRSLYTCRTYLITDKYFFFRLSLLRIH